MSKDEEDLRDWLIERDELDAEEDELTIIELVQRWMSR